MRKNHSIFRSRSIFTLAVAAIAASILASSFSAVAGDLPTAATYPAATAVANTGILRVASVSTAVEGNLLPSLVMLFEKETGIKTILTRDDEPYETAGKGGYDIVISHFGHRDVEKFVQNGLGLWPKTVFSNQLVLAGPTSDPAHIRGATSLVEAFRRIARAKAPYILNQTRGISYLTDVLWIAAGKPDKGDWFIDSGSSKKNAIELAAKKKGYVIWGLTPFLREQKGTRGIVPLVTGDSLLQRIMVTIVVNPEKVTGVNATAAARFQDYLLKPETQARILRTHYPGVKQALWAPAGRHNPGYALPK
ncbi:MAG: hypothetical protein VB050_04955 [Geobacteraceae bacterium]|nr:hypothetical protein [Geobacteraceae bacterium]